MEKVDNMNSGKKKMLYVTIPAYDGSINSFLTIELMKAKQLTYTDERYKDIDLQVEILNFESLVTRARNTLLRLFLDNTEGYDDAVWFSIDSDIVLPASDILDMYDKVQRYKVMTYPYRIKTHDTFKIVATGFKYFPERFMDMNEPDWNKTRIAIVEHAGTGLMALHKSIVLKLVEWAKQNDLYYYDDNGKEFYDVFKTEVGVIETRKIRTLLSEDWYVCHVIDKILNQPIYIDLYVTTYHITKNFSFIYTPQLLYQVLTSNTGTSETDKPDITDTNVNSHVGNSEDEEPIQKQDVN